MVPATREIICFTELSRSGLPSWPRKYFWATMLVAFCDQLFGNSTPRCSKAGLSGLPITASRISHSIWSKGCTPGAEYRRSIERPCRPFFGLATAVLDIKKLLSSGLSAVTTQDRSKTGRKKSRKAQLGGSDGAGPLYILCQLPKLGKRFSRMRGLGSG